MDKPKIRFITSWDKILFYLEDGDDLEIEVEKGCWFRFKCCYIDETHFSLEGHVYHILQFAFEKESYAIPYRPAKSLIENQRKETKNHEAMYDPTGSP